MTISLDVPNSQYVAAPAKEVYSPKSGLSVAKSAYAMA